MYELVNKRINKLQFLEETVNRALTDINEYDKHYDDNLTY